MSLKEVTISVKDAQKRKHQHQHLVYEDFAMHADDLVITRLVKELKDSVKETLEDPEFVVKVKMVL